MEVGALDKSTRPQVPQETDLIDELLADMDRRYTVDTEPSPPSGAAAQLLDEIKRALDKEKVGLLLDSCRDSVLDSIIRPFGLGAAMFKDQDGGNVATLHNFKQGVTATAADAAKYAAYKKGFEREKYENATFIKRRRQIIKGEEPITDAYTGEPLPRDGRAQLDHVVSAKEIDRDHRTHLFQSAEERQEMASADSNLVMTAQSINASKQDKKLTEWLDQEPKQSRDVQPNAERFGVNRAEAKRIDAASRKRINRKLLGAQFKKQGTELMRTGLSQGVRMGLQQSLGLLLRELVLALFDEVLDIFHNGFKQGQVDASFWGVLKERLARVAGRVVAKRRESVQAFRDGAISGFLSNLVTFLINSVLKTVARAGRIIREGFFSLYRAVKIALHPPEGLTLQQAAHEATKLLGTGLVISGGILIEEFVEKAVAAIPILGQMANLLTPVVMGIISGIASSITVYLIDRVDLLGVVAEERHGHVLAALDRMTAGLMEQVDASYAIFEVPALES